MVFKEVVIIIAEQMVSGVIQLVIAVRPEEEVDVLETLHCNAENVGNIYFSQTDAGSSVSVSCGEGFSGSYTRVCSKNGTWQAPTNNCGIPLYHTIIVVATRCPAHVFSLPSGEYSIPMNVAGTVERNCASGYEGNVQFVCTEGFTWSDPVENCRMRFALSS